MTYKLPKWPNLQYIGYELFNYAMGGLGAMTIFLIIVVIMQAFGLRF